MKTNYINISTTKLKIKFIKMLIVTITVLIFSLLLINNESIATPTDTKTLNSITIKTSATKLSYYKYETFDPTGLIITLQYQDNTTADISYGDENKADFQFNPDKFNDISTTSITVTYKGKSASISGITVEDRTILNITMTQSPKTEYVEGQTIDLTGLEFDVNYSKGNPTHYVYNATTSVNDIQITIDNKSGAVTKVNNNQETKMEVEVIYAQSYAIRYNIRVEPKKVASIQITNKPSKMTYIEDEEPDLSGLTIVATCNNGTNVTVTYSDLNKSDFSVLPAKLSLGQTSFDISYQNISTTLNQVTVNKKIVTAITLVNAPTKTTYIEGNNLDMSGLIINVSYNNNKNENIIFDALQNADKFIANITLLKLGDNEVDLVYDSNQNYHIKFPIVVNQKKILDIIIKQNANKVNYIEENEFNPEGLAIILEYDNGELIQVNYNDNTKDLFSFSLRKLAVNDTEVIVYYDKYSTAMPIKVLAKSIVKIELIQKPAHTIYEEGDTFEPDDLKIKIYYNNNTSEIVNYSNANSNLFEFDKKIVALGDTNVTATYSKNTLLIPIEVLKKSIQNNTNTTTKTTTNKTNNNTQTIVNTTNITKDTQTTTNTINNMVVVYDNVKQNEVVALIKESSTNSKKKNTETSNSTNSATTSKEKTIVKIELEGELNKNNYISGDIFDPKGLIIKVIYSDDSVEEIPYSDDNADQFDFDKAELSIDDSNVIVTYKGIKAQIPITVTTKQNSTKKIVMLAIIIILVISILLFFIHNKNSKKE